MKQRERWLVVVLLIITCLSLAACAGGSEGEAVEEAPPVVLEPIEGTDLNRVILSEKAAGRLGIETAQVQEETVMRERTVSGKVQAAQAGSSLVRVRVPITVADMANIAQGQPARVLTIPDDDDAPGEVEDEATGLAGLTAEAIESPEVDDDDPGEAGPLLYYQVDNSDNSLVDGQPVIVKLSMVGNGGPQLVIPYAAVLYDLHGETWVYTNPEPLVFVRQPITVDFVDGDRAVLLDGPPAGTAIVTVGAPELFGADTGVGK